MCYKWNSNDLNTLKDHDYTYKLTLWIHFYLENSENFPVIKIQGNKKYKILLNLSLSHFIEDIKFQLQDITGYHYDSIQILINEVEFSDSDSLMVPNLSP